VLHFRPNRPKHSARSALRRVDVGARIAVAKQQESSATLAFVKVELQVGKARCEINPLMHGDLGYLSRSGGNRASHTLDVGLDALEENSVVLVRAYVGLEWQVVRLVAEHLSARAQHLHVDLASRFSPGDLSGGHDRDARVSKVPARRLATA
jgi:hypothetical protein